MWKRSFGMLCGCAMVLGGFSFRAVEGQERIIPRGMEQSYEEFHYAPAVKVGNTVYASGVVSGNPDPEAQFTEIFEALSLVLREAGASLEDVVDMTTFHVDMYEHIETFMEVKDVYLPENFPAWTAIGVDRLFLPDFLVEVKVVAVIPEG